MKTLVTGGTGLLGNNLIRLLLERGEEVRVLVRGENRPELSGLDVDVRQGDIRDEAQVRDAIKGVDRVINSAAVVRIGWADPSTFQAVNVNGARHVASAARDVGARMVHVSTVNALGVGWHGRPADEENFNPDITPCPYVLTKREADERIRELMSDGLDAVIVHPGYMLGPWDWKPSSGEILLQFAKRYMGFAPTGGFSLVDARDVANGVLRALDRGESGRNYVLAGHNLTYRQGWVKFAAVARRWPPLLPVGPVNRVLARVGIAVTNKLTGREGAFNTALLELGRLHQCFSSARAERELGYHFRSAEETIQGAWDWFGENGYLQGR